MRLACQCMRGEETETSGGERMALSSVYSNTLAAFCSISDCSECTGAAAPRAWAEARKADQPGREGVEVSLSGEWSLCTRALCSPIEMKFMKTARKQEGALVSPSVHHRQRGSSSVPGRANSGMSVRFTICAGPNTAHCSLTVGHRRSPNRSKMPCCCGVECSGRLSIVPCEKLRERGRGLAEVVRVWGCGRVTY